MTAMTTAVTMRVVTSRRAACRQAKRKLIPTPSFGRTISRSGRVGLCLCLCLCLYVRAFESLPILMCCIACIADTAHTCPPPRVRSPENGARAAALPRGGCAAPHHQAQRRPRHPHRRREANPQLRGPSGVQLQQREHTHSHVHSLTCTLTHMYTHSHSHAFTNSLSLVCL